jgi:hypothetical protein
MDFLFPLLQHLAPLLGGGAVLVMALRIAHRYMELRFQEREQLRVTAREEEAAEHQRWSHQFDSLMSGATTQVKSLEELVDFIRRQWENDTKMKTDLMSRMELELRRLRLIMESCQRCAVILRDYEASNRDDGPSAKQLIEQPQHGTVLSQASVAPLTDHEE